MLTNRNVLLCSLFGLGLLFGMVLLQETDACYKVWSWCRAYLWDLLDIIGPFLLPFVPVFLLSAIVYKLHDEVFRTLLKFSALALPVAYFSIFTSPQDAIGGGLSAAMAVTRGQAAFQLSVIFFVFSLIVVTYKYLTLRKGGARK